MGYKVFLDTNIYQGANFSLENRLFSTLKQYFQAGDVELCLCSIIDVECKKHIRENVAKAVTAYNHQIKKEPAFAPLRKANSYSGFFQQMAPENAISDVIKLFDEYHSNCIKVSAEKVNVEKIICDYYAQNPPFTNTKPNEFKDAIAVASIMSAAQQFESDDTICVVSADGGFRDAINREMKNGKGECQKYQLFEKLDSFLEFMAKLKKIGQIVDNSLVSGLFDEIIFDSANSVLQTVDIHLEYPDICIDEYDVTDRTVRNISKHVLRMNDNHTASVLLSIEADVSVWYSFTDEDESFFDRETHSYLWQRTISKIETHSISFESVVALHIPECDESENYPEDSFEMATIDDVNDIPDLIELDEETCKESEIDEDTGNYTDGEDGIERAYDTCPECGCPIGISNDGGNGFCINCAPNH